MSNGGFPMDNEVRDYKAVSDELRSARGGRFVERLKLGMIAVLMAWGAYSENFGNTTEVNAERAAQNAAAQAVYKTYAQSPKGAKIAFDNNAIAAAGDQAYIASLQANSRSNLIVGGFGLFMALLMATAAAREGSRARKCQAELANLPKPV